MAIPVQILYSLRISTAQKLSVGVVFIVGVITMVSRHRARRIPRLQRRQRASEHDVAHPLGRRRRCR